MVSIEVLTATQMQHIHRIVAKKLEITAHVAKPQVLGMTLAYLRTGKEDVTFKAAVLLRNIAVNQPFESGNLITAFIATDVFLRLNGWFMKSVPGSYLKKLKSKPLHDIEKTIDINLAQLEANAGFEDNLKLSLEFNLDALRRIT
ncbi:Fic family protein [Candidatus Woesearchaeota archaeon]|nr:Fic family protein [Candidatus Woesearchaeota archaeon]